MANTKPITKPNYLHIRISDKDKETIARRAAEEQMSMSEYISFLVKMDAEKHDNK